MIHAERAGFDAAMCSDHFSPWSERQGQSGFAWSWLGAALQATRLPFGVVNAPGQRYHPAIIAQAIGTLGAMYPGRFWAALGTGEASNEHITGDPWPRKDVRGRPGCASASTSSGRSWPARRSATTAWSPSTGPGCGPAREQPPALIGAAVSIATARWCAEWADGLITVNAPLPHLREMIDATGTPAGGDRSTCRCT